jgi:hypothetical protein
MLNRSEIGEGLNSFQSLFATDAVASDAEGGDDNQIKFLFIYVPS